MILGVCQYAYVKFIFKRLFQAPFHEIILFMEAAILNIFLNLDVHNFVMKMTCNISFEHEHRLFSNIIHIAALVLE